MDETWWKSSGELDENQKAVINLSVAGDHLVTGPPGCGKTNLLMLRASFLYKQGYRNIAIVTLTRTLKEFLGAGTVNIKLSTNKVKTLFKWSYDVLREYDIEPAEENGFTNQREAMVNQLKTIIASGVPIPKFDCLLLDEVQDYTPDEIGVFRAFSNQIFAVGDSDQSIYDGTDKLAAVTGICGPPTVLRCHYRNGRKISRFADSIKGVLNLPDGLEATCLYDEIAAPSTVNEHVCKTMEEQAEIIKETIKTQLRAYPDEYIGVCCPKKAEVQELWGILSTSEIGDICQLQTQEGYSSFDPEKRVYVMTINGTKGLEFRALHIAAAHSVSKFRALQKRLSYTAVTRAKTSLNLYHNGQIPPHLERAFADINGLQETPELDELFEV